MIFLGFLLVSAVFLLIRRTRIFDRQRPTSYVTGPTDKAPLGEPLAQNSTAPPKFETCFYIGSYDPISHSLPRAGNLWERLGASTVHLGH